MHYFQDNFDKQYNLYFYLIDIRDNIYSFRISRTDLSSQLEIIWQILRKELTKIDRVVDYRLISLVLRELLRKVNISISDLLLSNKKYMPDEVIAWYYLFKFYGLQDLFPLIIDERITEIYININKLIYIDHIDLGRLYTEIFMDKERMASLILFLMFNTELKLVGVHPSSKTNLNILSQRIRISVDITDNKEIFVDMRKIPSYPPVRQYFNEKSQMLLLLIVALAVVSRRNVLIFGEINSGKTTIASILLDFLPNHWRLAVVEDVKEVPQLVLRGKNYIRLIVSELELRTSSEAKWIVKEKGTELLKLLHRSIDYLYVSELQDATDINAFFQIISAGIRALSTIHARNFHALIKRLKNVYNIAPELLMLVDLYVEMERNISISEGKIDRKLRGLAIPLNPKRNLVCIKKIAHIPGIEVIELERIKFLMIKSDAIHANTSEILACLLSAIFPKVNCSLQIFMDAFTKYSNISSTKEESTKILNTIKQTIWSLATCINN